FNYLSDNNPHRLDFDIPVITKDTMKPGLVGSVSDDPVRLKVFRRIAREVLNRTQDGLWLFSPATGTKGIAKRLRFTPAVADAVRNGLTLLPPGGGAMTVHVDEPT